MERLQSVVLQDVTVAYRQDDGIRIVLRDINLSLPEGRMTALIGGNGSGKSTLLKVIAGILPPSRGKVQRLSQPQDLVPVVFQNPDAQIVGQTVWEDVCFGLENTAVPPEEIKERADRALAAVGLAGFGDVPVSRLSGGQKQLLCIASVIAMQPSLLIFDEPTAMLDPAAKEQVLQVMNRLRQEGKTILWATQGIDEIGLADQVVALDDGEIVFMGTPEDFFYGREEDGDREGIPCHTLGFRLPYSIEVIHELKRSGRLHGLRPVTAEQCMEAVSGLWRSK